MYESIFIFRTLTPIVYSGNKCITLLYGANNFVCTKNQDECNIADHAKLRAQSFTTLKEDLRQEINCGFAFSRCLNGTFPWRKGSSKALVSYLRWEDLYVLHSSHLGWCTNILAEQFLQGNVLIKTPSKWRDSVYLLTEICHQRSKW